MVFNNFFESIKSLDAIRVIIIFVRNKENTIIFSALHGLMNLLLMIE